MTSNFNSWYEPQNFTVAGRRWSFTYSETTANRSLVSNDGIVLKIPITDINKYRSPYLWLCSHQSSADRGQKKSDVTEPNPTIFEIIPSKAQNEIIPSKAQNEIIPSKAQNEIIPSKAQNEIILSKSLDEIIPSNLPHGELRSTSKRRPKKRRPKGEGSGTFITTYASEGKYGKKYPQVSYQVEFGGKKRSIYLSKDKVDLIKALDRANKPLLEILGEIGSHKADLIARDYQDYLDLK